MRTFPFKTQQINQQPISRQSYILTALTAQFGNGLHKFVDMPVEAFNSIFEILLYLLPQIVITRLQALHIGT